MPDFTIIVVFLLVALGAFWLTSLKVREAAVKAARVACESEGLLLCWDLLASKRVHRTARELACSATEPSNTHLKKA